MATASLAAVLNEIGHIKKGVEELNVGQKEQNGRVNELEIKVKYDVIGKKELQEILDEFKIEVKKGNKWVAVYCVVGSTTGASVIAKAPEIVPQVLQFIIGLS